MVLISNINHLLQSFTDTLGFPVSGQNVTIFSYIAVPTWSAYSKFINVFDYLWSACFLLWCSFQHCITTPKHWREYLATSDSTLLKKYHLRNLNLASATILICCSTFKKPQGLLQSHRSITENIFMDQIRSFIAASQGCVYWQKILILASTGVVHWLFNVLFSQGRFTSA